MNIFIYFFLQNFSKTHQIAPFRKNSRGSMSPSPPSKREALPLAAWRESAMQTSTLFQKYLTPTPEIKS